MSMLKIDNLHVRAGDKQVLTGLSLEVAAGEVHAIMGPNGSGKSTLVQVLAGREGYEVTAGSVSYDGRNLLALPPEERAREGVFLAFQYPVEIPGVNNVYLLKAGLNAMRKHRGLPELDAYEFLILVREKMKLMHMDESFLNRGVNEGFSGGEKKRNEILQMAVLEPKLALLDETDSGLDIDALRVVASGVNSLRRADRAIVMVTHYQRLLDYIEPDRVHVLRSRPVGARLLDGLEVRLRPVVATAAGEIESLVEVDEAAHLVGQVAEVLAREEARDEHVLVVHAGLDDALQPEDRVGQELDVAPRLGDVAVEHRGRPLEAHALRRLREQTLAAVVPRIVRGRDLQELPRRVRSFEVVLVLQLVDRRAEHDVLVDRCLLLRERTGEQCQHDHLLPPIPSEMPAATHSSLSVSPFVMNA